MPKVLIDLRMVDGRMHGIARYALELCRQLAVLAPDGWSFAGLTGPRGLPGDLGPLYPPFALQRCAASFLSPLEQPLLALALMRSGCDLFHATSFSVPALWPGPLVVTLHDANHVALPENYGPGRLTYYRWIVVPRARRARARITVSSFSRAEIGGHLGLDPTTLDVVPSGVAERFRPSSGPELERFRSAHRLPDRFFLAVGNVKPHKNLSMLAKVSSALPAPIALLAGRGAAAALGFSPRTIELPDLSEDELALAYGAATALLLPSSYEGFGLPALEAMACGCPVVAADAGALPETVGEAGILISPNSPDDWVANLHRLWDDPAWRRRLREEGLSRAQSYRWEICAQRTLEIYRRATSDPRPSVG